MDRLLLLAVAFFFALDCGVRIVQATTAVARFFTMRRHLRAARELAQRNSTLLRENVERIVREGAASAATTTAGERLN